MLRRKCSMLFDITFIWKINIFEKFSNWSWLNVVILMRTVQCAHCIVARVFFSSSLLAYIFIWSSHTSSIQIMLCSITFFDFPAHVFQHCAGKSLQCNFIKHKKSEMCAGNQREKWIRKNRMVTSFHCMNVPALIHRCSHLDNYSHWLEFSVQCFMRVLLITIFSEHEYIHSFHFIYLFIHFHPYSNGC